MAALLSARMARTMASWARVVVPSLQRGCMRDQLLGSHAQGPSHDRNGDVRVLAVDPGWDQLRAGVTAASPPCPRVRSTRDHTGTRMRSVRGSCEGWRSLSRISCTPEGCRHLGREPVWVRGIRVISSGQGSHPTSGTKGRWVRTPSKAGAPRVRSARGAAGGGT